MQSTAEPIIHSTKHIIQISPHCEPVLMSTGLCFPFSQICWFLRMKVSQPVHVDIVWLWPRDRFIFFIELSTIHSVILYCGHMTSLYIILIILALLWAHVRCKCVPVSLRLLEQLKYTGSSFQCHIWALINQTSAHDFNLLVFFSPLNVTLGECRVSDVWPVIHLIERFFHHWAEEHFN